MSIILKNTHFFFNDWISKYKNSPEDSRLIKMEQQPCIFFASIILVVLQHTKHFLFMAATW